MKKNINKLVASLFVLALVLTSCNNDDSFTYELPEQVDVAQVTLSTVSSITSQCTAELTVATSDVAEVYYIIQPSSDETPDSQDVFDDGNELSFDSASSLIITTPTLVSGTAYTIYAVSVNKNGVRTEEVFTATYAQAAYTINVDTTYTSSVTAAGGARPSHTATLTPVPGATNQYTIDSAWGPNFVAALTGSPAFEGQFPYAGTLTINSDYSVTVVGAPTSPWATGGTGTYDPCTNVISYALSNALFSGTPFLTNVVLTPDNL